MAEITSSRRDARACAEVVVKAFPGLTTVERILMPSRGQPADALGRWMAMWVWITQEQRWAKPLSYTQAGREFGRDRTNVAVGVKRLHPIHHAALRLHLWPDHPESER